MPDVEQFVVCRLLQYCRKNGGYTGADFEEDEEDTMEDLIQRFAAVNLNTLGQSVWAIQSTTT